MTKMILFADLEVEENVMKDLEEDLATINDKFHVDYEMTAEELINIDFEISIGGIIAKVSGNSAESSDDDSDVEETETCEMGNKATSTDVMNAISILEDYSLYSKFGTDMLKALKYVNRAVDLESFLNKKSRISKIILNDFKKYM